MDPMDLEFGPAVYQDYFDLTTVTVRPQFASCGLEFVNSEWVCDV